MKFLSIWQGFKLSAMTPWYHLAAFCAGMSVDTSDVTTIYSTDDRGFQDKALLTAEEIMY
jgi:hypothetical protein